MTAKMIMETIGEIEDRYIMEFADVEEIKKVRIGVVKKCLFLAASVALIFLVGMAVDRILKEPTLQPVVDMEQVVWKKGNISQYGEEFDYTKLVRGNVYIGDSLKVAFRNFLEEDTVFAVSVKEETGILKEEVYEKFIIPLGVAEEYMERGVIFATREQIEEMHCPEDMLILLSHANKEKSVFPIEMKEIRNPYPAFSDDLYALINWQIENGSSEKIPVSIEYKDNYDAKKIEVMANAMAGDVAKARTQLNKQHIEQALEKFVKETGISYSDIESACSLIPLINLAWLTPEQLLELAEAPLVSHVEYVDVEEKVIIY